MIGAGLEELRPLLLGALGALLALVLVLVWSLRLAGDAEGPECVERRGRTAVTAAPATSHMPRPPAPVAPPLQGFPFASPLRDVSAEPAEPAEPADDAEAGDAGKERRLFALPAWLLCCSPRPDGSSDKFERRNEVMASTRIGWRRRFRTWSNVGDDRPYPELSCCTLLDAAADHDRRERLPAAQRHLQELRRRLAAAEDEDEDAEEARNRLQGQEQWATQLEKRASVFRRAEAEHADARSELQSEGRGIRAQHRADPALVHLRVEGLVAAPLFDVLALLYEVDLWHRWVPRVAGVGLRSARCLATRSRARLLFHVVVSLPWPFGDRDFVFSVDGIDATSPSPGEPEPRRVVILLDSEPCANAAPPQGCKRARLLGSSVILTPEEEMSSDDAALKEARAAGPGRSSGCYFQLLARVELQSRFPAWLLNAVARKLAYLVVERLRSQARLTQGEEYQSRMCDPSNGFYMLLRERLEQELPLQAAHLPPLRQGCSTAALA